MKLIAYKYRLYPNFEQRIALEKNFGCARFVWNQLVANFNSWTKENPPPKISEKTLKDQEEYSFLNEAISYALQQKRIDFDATKKQFFNPKRKTKLGRMKFKKKGVSKDSFRIPGQCCSKSFDFENRKVRLPKLGFIRCIFDREFHGEVRSVTISKNRCNQYFISVLVKEEIAPKQQTGRSIGIDVGLKSLAVSSDGQVFESAKYFRENQSKLKRAQQHLSRKNKGSNRYEKQRLKVAKLHLKVSNKRSHYNHQISSYLVTNFDHIFTENLNIKGMMKTTMAKSLADNGIAQLISMIQYKCDFYMKSFHKVDRFFPSSKTCNHCGFKNNDLTLGDREWSCPECGSRLDRDLNAAKNILDEGLRDLYIFTSDELADYKRREELRPKVIPFMETSLASSMKRLETSSINS